MSDLLKNLDWGYLGDLLLQVIPALLCIMVHEICHGAAAFALGDRTAADQGRLSLNPLRHVDLFGLLYGGLSAGGTGQFVLRLLNSAAYLSIALGLFNLIPFPPLDGYHILNDILLKGRLRLSGQVLTGFHILFLVLCYSTNIISNLMSTVTGSIWSNVVGFYKLLF